jgi:hypothetical protein
MLKQTIRVFLFAASFIANYIGADAKPFDKTGYKIINHLSVNSSLNTFKVQSVKFETWLPWAKKWRNSDKLAYSYSLAKLLEYDVEQGWDTINSAWVNTGADSFKYDNYDRLVLRSTKTWNNTAFEATAEVVDSFGGNMHIETVYGWSANLQLAQYRDLYYSDSSANDTLDINQGWDGNSWINSVMYQTRYYSRGKPSSILTYQWSGNKWQLHDKEENYYDTYGNDTLYIHQVPAPTSGKWDYVFLQRSQYTYSGSGLVTQLIQTGSYNNIHWELFNRYNYAYDANGNDSQYVVQDWDSLSKQWVNNGKYTFFYQLFTFINKPEPISGFNIFPNPCSERMNIEYYVVSPALTTISIMDVSGKEVIAPFKTLDEVGRHKLILDLPSFSSGFYFYMFRSGSSSFSGRLMINK